LTHGRRLVTPQSSRESVCPREALPNVAITWARHDLFDTTLVTSGKSLLSGAVAAEGDVRNDVHTFQRRPSGLADVVVKMIRAR